MEAESLNLTNTTLEDANRQRVVLLLVCESKAQGNSLRTQLSDDYDIIELIGDEDAEEGTIHSNISTIIVDMNLMGQECVNILDNLKRSYPLVPIIFRSDFDHSIQHVLGSSDSTESAEPFATLSKNASSGDLTEAVTAGVEYRNQIIRNKSLTEELTRINDTLASLVATRSWELTRKREQTLKELERRNAIIEKELDKARKIQSALLPRKIPRLKNLDISTLYLPMDKVGGDLYGFVEFHNGDLGLFVADVSGHGIPAAFIASMVKLQFDFTAPIISSPAETLFHLNKCLLDKTGGHFLTIFYGIIKTDNRFIYAKAGHCNPYVFRKASGELEELQSRGKILGVFPDTLSEDCETTLEVGDRLVLYTDGLIEARNDQELFGDSRFSESLIKGMKYSSYEYIDSIMEDVEIFSGKKSFEDDVTIMVVDRSE